jgi:succinate dehydrogenase / fumarate reductase cytochrome b subunit
MLRTLDHSPCDPRCVATLDGGCSSYEEGKGLMGLFSDSIGRKVVMAISGLLMVLFVIGHLAGNLSIFAGPDGLNSYAQHLHELAPVVWATRVVMGAAVILHLIIAIQVTTENSAAKPTRYAVSRSLRATFASKTMIWTGVLIGGFIVYHLLHFTFRITPGLVLGNDGDRFDVYSMVVGALGNTLTGLVYIAAMVSLFLHLSHGIQSAFQSLGLSNGKLLPKYSVAGTVASVIFLVGFGSIPAVILVGILGK